MPQIDNICLVNLNLGSEAGQLDKKLFLLCKVITLYIH